MASKQCMRGLLRAKEAHSSLSLFVFVACVDRPVQCDHLFDLREHDQVAARRATAQEEQI